MKLAHAITAHKIQGQTIPWPITVVLGLNSVFDDAQALVMLSRVQQLLQVFILDKMDDSFIRTSHKALKELNRLTQISRNKNPTPWEDSQRSPLKIASLNCAGLESHYEDIKTDTKLQRANIIHLSEISLDKHDEGQHELDGYNSHFIIVGNGKGIATYYMENFTHKQDFISPQMQITKFSSERIDTINVYRSQNGHLVELLTELRKMLQPGRPTLITGDFNLCYMTNINNRMGQGLENQQFRQLVKEPTHIRGGHIDHVYFRDDTNEWEQPVLERYSPYYSDHDCLCITLYKW